MEDCKILQSIFDRSPYFEIARQQLWETAKEELFQELLDAGVINIKTIVAFDVIFYGELYCRTNPRKLKRCYRCLRKHAVNYDDLLERVNERWMELYNEDVKIQEIFMNMLLGGRR